MNRFVRFFVPLLIVVGVLAGCGGPAVTENQATTAPTAQTPAQDATAAPSSDTSAPTTEAPTTAPDASSGLKSVTVQMGANDPRSIDPQRAIDTRDFTLLAQLFPSLIILEATTYEILPGMATEWEVSDDGLVYTFHLLKDVPWVQVNPETGAVEQLKDETGKPRVVTAKDFVYGFLRALDPEIASPASYILAPYIAGAAEFSAGKGSREQVGVKAIDDYTLQITAPEKIGFALGIYSIISARAVPEWTITANGDAWTEPKNISSYGPFALKEWQHESSQTFVKNSFWPGSKGIRQPKLDQVTVRFIDSVVGLREYEAGTIDSTGMPSDQIERIRSDAALSEQLTIVPGACTQSWGTNTQKPPFDNVHIRRAFNYAVDRETLVKDVLAGGEIAAGLFAPPSIAGAPSGTPNPPAGISFDAEKAKQELELGLKDLGLDSADKLPKVTVEFGTSPQLSAIAQTLQAMWKETLGVQVELAQIDNTVYWSKQEKDAAQIFRAGWCPDYNDANNFLRDVYRSDSIYNYGKWKNEKFDKLVDEARVETDPAKRLQLYTEAEQILNVEDAGTMTLYYPISANLTKPTLKRTFPLHAVDYFWDWEIVEQP